tara:strand:+ start:1009 stop:2406 length:1398 start_codon:yes stop_codon:yes gene_type:complete
MCLYAVLEVKKLHKVEDMLQDYGLNKGMAIKVLSLFDGMSCGQIALDQLGIEVDTYYASEIDKYAIEITQKNFPETIQVGDITKLDPKDFADVDLIMGGSPCQGFSFAGKQLAFDDPRSALFFEFIRMLKAIKPKYFLLENVRMKKEFVDIISQQVSECYPEITFGIQPILINSSLLSAQSRQRFYWTNIPNIKQPEERGIVLRDILENDVDNEFYHGKKSIEYMERGNDKWQQAGARRADRYEQTADKKKSFTITENWHKGVPYNYFKETKPKQVGSIKDGGQGNRIYSQDGKSSTLSSQSGGTAGVGNALVETKPKQVGIAADISGHDILKRVYSPEGKSPTLNTMGGGNREPKVVTGGAFRGRAYDKDGKRMDRDGSSVANKTKQMLELRKDDKSNAITTVGKDSVVVDEELTWRKLTPLECERLQTVPDNYTDGVSNTQRYKMLGNGWTVEVIKHILGEIK